MWRLGFVVVSVWVLMGRYSKIVPDRPFPTKIYVARDRATEEASGVGTSFPGHPMYIES